MSEHNTTENSTVNDDSHTKPTVVHIPTGVGCTFDSMEELELMFHAMANFFEVRESCREFQLLDSEMTMMDVYEHGGWRLNEYAGYGWLSTAFNGSEAMMNEYNDGVYDEMRVSDQTSY